MANDQYDAYDPDAERRKALAEQLGQDGDQPPQAGGPQLADPYAPRYQMPDQRSQGPATADNAIEFPKAQGPIQAPASSGSSRDDAIRQIQDAYSRYGLNINDNANNLPSEIENWGKYGLSGLESSLQQRASSNGGGAQGATSQYSGGGGGGNGGGDYEAGLAAFLSQLQSRDANEQAQRDQMRAILMEQLGEAGKPVSESDPGISQVLGGQRLALRRGLDGGVAQAAEQRAYEGYGANSDQLRMDRERLGEASSEADAQMTGQVLGGEMQQRRQQLTQLLNMAIASGDAEGARAVQAQLQAMGMQLGQTNYNNGLAFQYTNLNANMNMRLQELLAMLGAE